MATLPAVDTALQPSPKGFGLSGPPSAPTANPVHRAGDESRQPSPTGVQQGGEGTTGGSTTGDQSAAAAADADEAVGVTEDDQVLQSSHSDLHDAQTEMLFKRGALLPIMWKGIKQPSALLRLLQLGGPPSSAAASSSANTLTTASASSVEAEKLTRQPGLPRASPGSTLTLLPLAGPIEPTSSSRCARRLRCESSRRHGAAQPLARPLVGAPSVGEARTCNGKALRM